MSLSERVVASYNETQSLNATVEMCGISRGKVRKILLTSGIVPESEQTQRIIALHDDGLSDADIAAALEISTKAVNAHLPYKRVEYGKADASVNALHIRRWRQSRAREAAV